MILLDPDLDAHPAALATKAATSPEARQADREARLPSARALNAFLSEAQAAVRLKGMVSVLLTTDKAIRTLKNRATDVLSFPAARISRGEVAGDLAISVDTARKQAREQGHSLSIEIKVLMIHGLLHLAGYDHETDAGEMARRERILRAKLALPLGLIERAAGSAATRAKKVRPERGGLPTLATGKSRKNGAPGVGGAASKRTTADPSTPRRSDQDDTSRKGGFLGPQKAARNRMRRRAGA
jgi:probable rRNA maturation factor